MRQHGSDARLEIGFEELQGKLAKVSYLSEYSEIVLNYGLSLIFCVAFPLGPAFYWAYNWLEQYTDAYKSFTLAKRPFPHKACNVGAWDDVMKFLSALGIATNLGLIYFTADAFGLKEVLQLKYFGVLEHLFIFVFVLVLGYSSKTSESKPYTELTDALKRQKYLVQHLGSQGLSSVHS
jgi:hypothetical protein